MIQVAHLHAVGVPRNVAAWFKTHVQVVGNDFYFPRWLVHDALSVRYPSDLPEVKLDIAVDARRQILVVQPLVYTPGTKLRETEHRAFPSRYPNFLRVRLSIIREIFQVQPPARYPVTINRRDAAIFVKMRTAQEPSPCIR